MSTAGNTPNFVAETAIYPFRCVKIGTANFSAVPSTGDPEILLGVTDGSVRDFNSQYHATAGQPVSLQNGEFVQLTASGTISVGDLLIATTDGKVMADTVATEYVAQAADNATDGEVFWAKKIGAWTVGGGGGGAMTIDVQEFDNPEAENTWVKPAGAVWVTVRMCGAGQDGAANEWEVSYGGNGGTVAEKHFDAAALPASVGIVIGVHQPWATASDVGTSAFGTYLYAGMAAAFGAGGSDSGGSTIEYCGCSSLPGVTSFGHGFNFDNGTGDGALQGFAFGPGGGGGCSPFDTLVISGGRASTNGARYFAAGSIMTIQYGGGGAAGTADGIGPGGNGGNGNIDPATGFGDGGGGGGYGGPGEDGGNGGNAFRGGGGGGAGLAGAGGSIGLPGSGGDGYVRVTTICYN